MLREASTPATAYAAHSSPFDIRYWRSQNMIDGLGERVGQGYLYSVTDAACIAIGAFIARNGIGAREAFSIVSDRRGVIDGLVKAELGAQPAGSDHVLTFALNQEMSTGYQSITGAPIERCLLDQDLPGALQVNTSAIVRTVIARLAFFEKHLNATAD
jgi:hypothetical protein